MDFIPAPTREIKIYPNPNNGNFTIETNGYFTEYDLYIYDFTGKIIKSVKDCSSWKITLSVENQSQGIYLVRIVGNEKQFTSSVIVQ